MRKAPYSWELFKHVKRSISSVDEFAFKELSLQSSYGSPDRYEIAEKFRESLGQEDAEFLLKHPETKMPSSGCCIVFPGTVWRDREYGILYVPCIESWKRGKIWKMDFQVLPNIGGCYEWIAYKR